MRDQDQDVGFIFIGIFIGFPAGVFSQAFLVSDSRPAWLTIVLIVVLGAIGLRLVLK